MNERYGYAVLGLYICLGYIQIISIDKEFQLLAYVMMVVLH